MTTQNDYASLDDDTLIEAYESGDNRAWAEMKRRGMEGDFFSPEQLAGGCC